MLYQEMTGDRAKSEPSVGVRLRVMITEKFLPILKIGDGGTRGEQLDVTRNIRAEEKFFGGEIVFRQQGTIAFFADVTAKAGGGITISAFADVVAF